LLRSVKTLSKLAKPPDKASGHFSDRELNPMNSPYRAHATSPIECAAPASKVSDRFRLLALAEEEYYLSASGQPLATSPPALNPSQAKKRIAILQTH
jgi:hypothetical protein